RGISAYRKAIRLRQCMHLCPRSRSQRLAFKCSVLDAMLDTRYLAWIFAGAFVLVGCDAQHPANAPIAIQDLTKGYRLQRVKADPDNPGDVLVILTLSGGGES